MGLRLQGIYPDITDTFTYYVKIIDTEWAGAVEPIDIEDRVIYNYEGRPLDMTQKIIPTTADFSFRIYTQAGLDFVEDLIAADEGQMWLEVRRIDPTRGSVLEFVGLITVEQTELEDVPLSLGIKYSISAMDSIAQLKDVPYLAAQVQPYITQTQDGKFRSDYFAGQGPSYPRAATGVKIPFTNAIENVGGHYQTGIFAKSGDYIFKGFVSLVGSWEGWATAGGYNITADKETATNGIDVKIRIAKKDINNDLIDLVNPVVLTWSWGGLGTPSTERKSVNITTESVYIEEVEDVRLLIEWEWNVGYLSLLVDGNSYFENEIDAEIVIENVYAPLSTHIKNLFSQLPTYDFYSDGHQLIKIAITHIEATQGAAKAEDHIGLAYNAFVTDFKTTPPKVLSVYECLEAICQLLPGAIAYREGKYFIYSFHSAAQYNSYTKSMFAVGTYTSPWSEYPLNCIGRGRYTYLPPLHAAISTYERIATQNILYIASSFFPAAPGALYTTEASLVSRTYILKLVIRVHLGYTLPGFDVTKEHRHIFKSVLRIADGIGTYIRVYNLNGNEFLSAVYSVPEIAFAGDLFVQGSLVEGGAKEHFINVQYEISFDKGFNFGLSREFKGELAFGLEYEETMVKDPDLDPINPIHHVVSPDISWSLDEVKFVLIDHKEDKIYKETLSIETRRERNSSTIEESMLFSDLWLVDTDPGAIKVNAGGEWVRPGTWGGQSLSVRISQYLANTRARAVKVYNRTFTTHDHREGWIQLDADTYMIMLYGSYDTHMQQLEGQWVTYRDTLNLSGMNTIIRTLSAGTSAKTDSLNSGSVSSTGGTGTTTQIPPVERYHYFTDSEITEYIAIPEDMRLPDPADYTIEQMMCMFAGTLKGSGNMTYRAVPTRPEHFAVDVENQRLVLSRAAAVGQEYFVTWFLL